MEQRNSNIVWILEVAFILTAISAIIDSILLYHISAGCIFLAAAVSLYNIVRDVKEGDG